MMRSRRGVAWVVFVAALMAPVGARAQGVTVGLIPATRTVAPGSDVTLSIEITRAGSPFNAFDLTIGYDPAALILMPTVPISKQEGAYFVAACGNRFHQFRVGAGRDTIADVLLCPATSLIGPGQIYTLRFHASTTPQITTVRLLAGTQFYNGGLYANPDSTSDAVIGIGMGVSVAPPAAVAPSASLAASPHPPPGRVLLRLETDRPGRQQLDIRDVLGRLVRRLADGEFPAGARTVMWDARDDAGNAVRAGRYTATLRVPGRTVTATISVLK